MPILVERSLFKTGESLAVTLPIKWVRYHHLGRHNKVEIIIDDDLIMRPKQNSAQVSPHKERDRRGFYRLRFSILARDGFRFDTVGVHPKKMELN